MYSHRSERHSEEIFFFRSFSAVLSITVLQVALKRIYALEIFKRVFEIVLL